MPTVTGRTEWRTPGNKAAQSLFVADKNLLETSLPLWMTTVEGNWGGSDEDMINAEAALWGSETQKFPGPKTRNRSRNGFLGLWRRKKKRITLMRH